MFSAGDVVPSTHCANDPPPTEETCEVACSADCVVGSWSSWSTCSHSCATKLAEGKQSRTRTVLAIPGKGNPKFPLITLSHFWLDVRELIVWCTSDIYLSGWLVLFFRRKKTVITVTLLHKHGTLIINLILINDPNTDPFY